ncbi:MAG: DUF4224 domain-containing protein [Pseudomonadota bacterium]
MIGSIQIEFPIESEALTPEELRRITGRARARDQIEWLEEKGWRFEANAAGEPIVGRFYARFKLAGIDLARLAPAVGAPDFSKVR